MLAANVLDRAEASNYAVLLVTLLQGASCFEVYIKGDSRGEAECRSKLETRGAPRTRWLLPSGGITVMKRRLSRRTVELYRRIRVALVRANGST